MQICINMQICIAWHMPCPHVRNSKIGFCFKLVFSLTGGDAPELTLGGRYCVKYLYLKCLMKITNGPRLTPPQVPPVLTHLCIWQIVVNQRQNINFASLYIKNLIQGCPQSGIFFAFQGIKQYQTQIKAIIAIASSIRMGDK